MGRVAVWVGFWHTPVLSLGPQVLDGLELAPELVAELEELPGGDLLVRSAMVWKISALSRRSMGIGKARAM